MCADVAILLAVSLVQEVELRPFAQAFPRRAFAILGAVIAPAAMPPGAAALPPASVESAPISEPPAAVSEAPASDDERVYPSAECLATTLCSVKDRIRWGTPAWQPDFCRKIASAVLTSAKAHDLSATLLLGVMMNESDLDEKAIHPTMKNGKLYAKDSGLMGIRCVLDRRGRCSNGAVKGMSWRSVMDPVTNIELGARELARWREGGAVVRKTVRVRNAAGELETKQKFVPCHHKTHAYWAHYNHGLIYIDHGPARHYPHRVAVLSYAMARALSVEPTELKEVERITMRDPGQRARTADRPVEPRFRKLCSQIEDVATRCSDVAALTPLHGTH
jgi:hypothetical protein